MHYQVSFNLTGVRQSKISLLKLFQEHFKNTSGLTLQKALDNDAVTLYLKKNETGVECPFYYVKKKIYLDPKIN